MQVPGLRAQVYGSGRRAQCNSGFYAYKVPEVRKHEYKRVSY